MADKTAPLSRQDIIDAEAKRRCRIDGNSLEMFAFQDRRFCHDDNRPYWKAVYGRHIEYEIELLEKAGLKVVVA